MRQAYYGRFWDGVLVSLKAHVGPQGVRPWRCRFIPALSSPVGLLISPRRHTQRSASATKQTSTKEPCGRSPALKELTAADEVRIGALVKKAVS
jgi:hypothetical protein